MLWTRAEGKHFPSVDVQGDHATVDSVLDLPNEEGQYQDKITSELALGESGRRIVMREESYEFFLGPREETTPWSIHPTSWKAPGC
jgi:hypothetical protein